MMRNISAIFLSLVLSLGCKKNNDGVLVEKATVTFLHNSCEKTILKITAPNKTVGVSWSNQLLANPVVHQNVIGTYNMINEPTGGLNFSKSYSVKIYSKTTASDIICLVYDPVKGPGVNYDIEFIK